jgi:hypothetical protein
MPAQKEFAKLKPRRAAAYLNQNNNNNNNAQTMHPATVIERNAVTLICPGGRPAFFRLLGNGCSAGGSYGFSLDLSRSVAMGVL